VPFDGEVWGHEPSAISPKKGTSPMPKSRTMLTYIFALTSAGRPPSTCSQVRRTMMAMNASITSPILTKSVNSYASKAHETHPGMIPIRLPHPNLIPQQLNRHISRRYALLLTFVRTFPSCSDIPAGSAFLLFFVFLEGLPSNLVAGTLSK